MDNITFFSPNTQSTGLLFVFIVIMVSIMLFLTFMFYRYRLMKLYEKFAKEMLHFNFNQDQALLLTSITKRNSVRDPLSVLFSLKLFDELASKEISKILSSQVSSIQKQQFINHIYEIRKKTFFQSLPPAVPIPAIGQPTMEHSASTMIQI